MSQVNLPTPDEKDLSGVSNLKSYLERLVQELEYNLENVDEDNMTESFKKKLKGEE